MITKDVTVINKLGLHARAAAKFVTTASRFSSDVQVSRNGRKVNGKSIMGIMMLAASKGTVLTITADGEDENEAMGALLALVEHRFDEEE